MQARMANPATLVPDAIPALTAVRDAVRNAGLPKSTLDLVYLRTGQVNGSSWNVNKHAADLREAGEPDERIRTVAAWRDAPGFTDAERAALALAEDATRLSDRPNPVSDEVWEEAAKHYPEPELAALLLAIGLGNFWHRLMTTTRQPGVLPAS